MSKQVGYDWQNLYTFHITMSVVTRSVRQEAAAILVLSEDIVSWTSLDRLFCRVFFSCSRAGNYFGARHPLKRIMSKHNGLHMSKRLPAHGLIYRD